MNMSRHQKKILAQKTKRNSAKDLCSWAAVFTINKGMQSLEGNETEQREQSVVHQYHSLG